MSCEACGHEREGDVQPHNLGCSRSLAAIAARAAKVPALPEPEDCEHDGCSKPKKEWSGKGARPKYCAAGHK